MDHSNQTCVAPVVHATPARSYRWPIALAVLWIAAILIGLYGLENYANTPGTAGEPPQQWPRQTGIELNPTGATLVMFVHPQCSCTRASMTELQRTLARCTGSVTPWIVFYKPASMPSGWEQSDLWRTAETIPGAHVISDLEGAEARRFHAATSGQTVLYDAEGKLLFSGGITGARGHEGDNAGEAAIEDLVNAAKSDCRQTPVFGCPIVPSRSSQ
jgi:hypothetical protein